MEDPNALIKYTIHQKLDLHAQWIVNPECIIRVNNRHFHKRVAVCIDFHY